MVGDPPDVCQGWLLFFTVSPEWGSCYKYDEKKSINQRFLAFLNVSGQTAQFPALNIWDNGEL